MHSPKGKIVQFDQFPVIPLRMLSSKAVLSPDMSPMAPNHQSPSHATFSTTMRKNCKEIDSELKKSETAMKRQSMDYLRALAMLPRFQFRENSQLQSKQDIFKAARNFNEKNKPSVSRNQMIYRTDDPEFVLNLSNLRKSNFENKPKREILGKIYVTEFWDKNHHQNIVTNAKLLDKARHTGKYQARKSFVNFQEIIEKRMIIEERKNKKGVSPLSEGNIFMGVENYQDLMKNPNSLVNFSSTKETDKNDVFEPKIQYRRILEKCEKELEEDSEIRKEIKFYQKELNSAVEKKRIKKKMEDDQIFIEELKEKRKKMVTKVAK